MEFTEELRSLKDQLRFTGRLNLPEDFDNVVIAGVGGSGIAGRMLEELYKEKPVILLTDYEVPDFLTDRSVFIGMSYSGNTEETLATTKLAIERGARVFTVSSGGELQKYGTQHVKISVQGMNPRSAIGYQLMLLLTSFGLAKKDELDRTSNLLAELDDNNDECLAHAKKIADGKLIPVIYGASPFGSVAYRWKTQFNENAKVLAYSGSFPEINHNDTMALAQTHSKHMFYFFAFGSHREKISKRIRVTAEVTATDFHTIEPKGRSTVEKLFYLLHYGDYVTYHLGRIRGIDPSDVSKITELKNRMAED